MFFCPYAVGLFTEGRHPWEIPTLWFGLGAFVAPSFSQSLRVQVVLIYGFWYP